MEPIQLQKFQAADFEEYLKLYQDEDEVVMTYVTGRAVPREEAAEEYKKLLLNNQIHPSFGFFKILHKGNTSFMGWAKLKVTDQFATEAELGYILHKEFWGRGIGSRVVQSLIEIAKREKQIKVIKAIIDPKNSASRKILIRRHFETEQFCEIDDWPSEILSLKI